LLNKSLANSLIYFSGMLRGMGFKDGQGVGGFKQLSVACIEPVVRPKGLGLGAAKPKQVKYYIN